MPLIPQKVPVKLGRLDTKTDSRWLLPGDLVSSSNLIFDNFPKLRKRNGFAQLSAAAAGSTLTPFKTQLLLGTGTEAFALGNNNALADQGVLESFTVSTQAVQRDILREFDQNSAVHPSGITVHAWEDTSNTNAVRYSVFATATGQQIVGPTTLSINGVKPKPFALGNYVVILFHDRVTAHLRFVGIPAANPTAPTAVTDFAIDPATSELFDATVIGGLQGQMFVVYANNGGANKITLKALTAQLVVGAPTVPITTESFTGACAIFGDLSQNVWVAYLNSVGTSVNLFVYDFALANKLLDFTQLDTSPGTVRNITGIFPGTTGTVLYEASGTQTYNNLISSVTVKLGLNTPVNAAFTQGAGTLATGTYFYRVTATNLDGETLPSAETSLAITGPAGVNVNWTAVPGATGYKVYGRSTGAELLIGTVAGGAVTTFLDNGSVTPAGAMPTVNTTVVIVAPSTFKRSVGLASKLFFALNRVHVLATYQSALQSTYFVLSATASTGSTVVGKIALSVGGGLTARAGALAEVNNSSSGVFQFNYLQTTEIGVQSGLIFSQAGVMSATLDFNQPQTAVELSDNLHLTGGMVSMYDGARVVEHGFHLYPENVGLAGSATGGNMLAGTYNYVLTYEWMDAQGLVHQSSPSPIFLGILGAGVTAGSVVVTIPTLRLTSKTNPISVVVWRTQANQKVFFRLNSIANPLLNSTTADTVSFTDTAADTAISGNAQIYSNPLNVLAEIPNLAAPAPLHVWRYRNRVAMIPAENPFQWMFSKAFVPTVPIEFNPQQFFQAISQDGGPLTCGIEMDEKNILFSANRVYYVVGDGPAPNGTNNDYGSAPQNIPSDVGCINRKSLVLTPFGVMFQSAKGIYLLTRGLAVAYIGAPIEAFNNLTITAAKLVPNSRRVVFFTNGGVALVYDYTRHVLTEGQEPGLWSVWTNINASDAATFGGLLNYVKPTGQLMQETPGVYNDSGAPVLVGFQLSNIAFAGLSGFQRVWRFAIRGDYRGPHTLSVSVAYDDNPAPAQTELVAAQTVLGPGAVAGSLVADTENPGDGQFPAAYYVVKCKRQKAASIQVTVQESHPAGPVTEGLSISGITFLVGIAKGLRPVPASRAI